MHTRSLWLVLCAVMLLACGRADDPSTSGGSSTGGGGTGGGSVGCLTGCQRGFQCSNSRCTLDPTAQWVLTVTSGSVLDRKPSGDAWDPFGGLPDPFVCLTINGVRSCTSVQTDTVAPSWNESVPAATALALQAGVLVEFYDYDPTSSNDPICSAGTVSVDESNFSSGVWGAQCTSGRFSARLAAR